MHLESSRKSYKQGCVGFWDCGHFSIPCFSVHANCTQAWCCHSPAHHMSSHCTTHNCPFRWVASIPLNPKASNSQPWSTKSFPSLCWPHHWCTYPACWIILELAKGKTEAYERMPCKATRVVLGWIYVAGEARTQCQVKNYFRNLTLCSWYLYKLRFGWHCKMVTAHLG